MAATKPDDASAPPRPTAWQDEVAVLAPGPITEAGATFPAHGARDPGDSAGAGVEPPGPQASREVAR